MVHSQSVGASQALLRFFIEPAVHSQMITLGIRESYSARGALTPREREGGYIKFTILVKPPDAASENIY